MSLSVSLSLCLSNTLTAAYFFLQYHSHFFTSTLAVLVFSPPLLLLCNVSPARLQPVTSTPICSPLVLCASLRCCCALCSPSRGHFLCTLSLAADQFSPTGEF